MDRLPGTNITPAEIGRLALILLGMPWAFVGLLMLTGVVDPPIGPFVWIAYGLGSVAAWGAFLSAVTDTRTLLGRKESPAPSPAQETHNTAVNLKDVSTGRDLIIRDIYVGDQYITQPADRPDALFHDVPGFPPHFVGREEIVADLVARLTEGGTVALSAEGLPGVGKTTLAVALAHHRAILDHFTDGVLWAGLGAQPDLLTILAGWGGALGVDVTDRPTAAGRAAAVHNAIGQRRLLLVIDDAWTGAAAHALRLGGPGCAHLLTTRDQAIARSFGTVQSVEVLEPGPARQLLADLAPITAQADPDLVGQLLAAVGYLPLAIQLLGGYLNGEDGGEPVAFAAQARTVLARLADPTTRPATVTERLNAAIALSLEGAAQADRVARSVFHALGAFAPKPARFDVAAAQAVTQGETATLARLIQRNLLEKGPDESLALHQTLADFARTATSPDAADRHRDHYLALVNQDRQDWQTIKAIYEQIQWAWRYCPDDQARFQLADGLVTYQIRRGFLSEKIDWASQCRMVARHLGDSGREALYCLELGFAYSALGENQKALSHFEEALPLYRQVGDKSGKARTLTNIGVVYRRLDENEKALIYYKETLPLFRQIGDKSGEATTLNNMGRVYSNLGEKQKALNHFEEALLLYRHVEDKAGEAATLNNIADLYFSQDDHQRAVATLKQAIVMAQQIGDVSKEALYSKNLAVALLGLGRTAEAIGYLECSISLLTRYNLAQDAGGGTLAKRKGLLKKIQAHGRSG